MSAVTPPIQPGLEGITAGLPLANVTSPPRAHPTLEVPNAFVRVMYPNYFQVDPETFDEVTLDAFEQSDPRVLEEQLYKKTTLSMRSPDRATGWVMLSPTEYTVTLNYPEEFANRAQQAYLTTLAGIFHSPKVARENSVRYGAHQLEARLKPMGQLVEGFERRIADLRQLVDVIPIHFGARTQGVDLLFLAGLSRGLVREALESTALVREWSPNELRLALIGLDRRLLEGRSQKRLLEKKASWDTLTKVMGNHTIAKKVVVRDRYLRSKFDITKRYKKAPKV